MDKRYGYKYAVLRENGMCIATEDTTSYILDPLYVPIADDTLNYLLKYYHPIPESVTSFNDFQGKWYTSSALDTEWIPE